MVDGSILPDADKSSLSELFRQGARSRLTGREQQVRQAVLDYLDSYRRGDIEARLALFAADATFEDPVGGPLTCGRGALRQLWLGAAAFRIAMELELLAVNGNEAAYVFTARVEQDGGDVARIRTIETLELDEAGLIRSMRAFFDASSIA
jgi:steroid Delta-isomerase